MPGGDAGGDHDELVDHESRVGEQHHAGKGPRVARLRRGVRRRRGRGVEARDQQLRAALDYHALVDGDCDPDEEGAVAEAFAGC